MKPKPSLTLTLVVAMPTRKFNHADYPCSCILAHSYREGYNDTQSNAMGQHVAPRKMSLVATYLTLSGGNVGKSVTSA